MHLNLVDIESLPTVMMLIIKDDTGNTVNKVEVDSAETAMSIAGADWISGKACCYTMRNITYSLGDVVNTTNGVVIYLASDAYVRFSHDEYSGELPNITIDQATIDNIPNKRIPKIMKNLLNSAPKIVSVTNGELVVS